MKIGVIAAITIVAGFLGAGVIGQEASHSPLDQALRKARVGGKYRMLLRQIRVESDVRQFGLFHDFGINTQTTCDDYVDLPRGHWVYVYPHWYIWRDRTGGPETKRAWGPEQATGEADTPEPGDRQTAWASSSQDGEDEWLMLEFEKPVRAYSVHIYETCNPGSVVRITGFTLDGSEVDLWRRPRPVIPSSPGYLFRPVLSKRVVTNRIKLEQHIWVL